MKTSTTWAAAASVLMLVGCTATADDAQYHDAALLESIRGIDPQQMSHSRILTL